MASFHKTIIALNNLAVDKQQEAEACQHIIHDALIAKAEALKEGERASTIADNLAKIMG